MRINPRWFSRIVHFPSDHSFGKEESAMYKTNEGGIKNVAVSSGIKNEDASKSVVNCFGEVISGIPSLAPGAPGWTDNHGNIHPLYCEPNDNVDENGFDRHKPIDQNFHVPKWSIVIRYGNEGGFNLTTPCKDFDKIALGYDINTVQFHIYVVISDNLYVTKGTVGPQPQFGHFGRGGGVQYLTRTKIKSLVNSNVLWRIS